MFWSAFITGLGFIIFSISTNPYIMGIVIFITSIASCSLEILVNVVLLMEGKHDPKFYINLSYAIYGIGSIFGPIIIVVFGLKGPIIIGACLLVSSVGFLMTKSPESASGKK